MRFIALSTLALLASSAAAFPHIRRQEATNGTVEAPAIGLSMGCTIMANACKFYIKTTPCTEEWRADVEKCIPESCSSLRQLAMSPCESTDDDSDDSEPEDPQH
ncbi:hypothetical protein TWF696_003305 [Orbilia brochopaga]|uniref:Uncharacterized protein n=1 Tax=Orbilia brochopaga TaxID=3140254 RepID=A0AAV9U1U7_9PEZI